MKCITMSASSVPNKHEEPDSLEGRKPIDGLDPAPPWKLCGDEPLLIAAVRGML